MTGLFSGFMPGKYMGHHCATWQLPGMNEQDAKEQHPCAAWHDVATDSLSFIHTSLRFVYFSSQHVTVTPSCEFVISINMSPIGYTGISSTPYTPNDDHFARV